MVCVRVCRHNKIDNVVLGGCEINSFAILELIIISSLDSKKESRLKKEGKAKLNISKIKHPDSRKAQQFIRRKKKEATRARKKITQFMKLNSFGEKILWFKNNLDPNIQEYSPSMVVELIQKYLHRFSEEMSIIKSVKSYEKLKYASRKDLIRHTIESETEEFNGCGIEIPDILNKEHLEKLRKWNGELRYLQNLTIVRYNKKQLENNVNL
ncbi:hypothetical protein PGB90_003100 [Kerria lacca]